MTQPQRPKRFTIQSSLQAVLSEKLSGLFWLIVFLVGGYLLSLWALSIYAEHGVTTLRGLDHEVSGILPAEVFMMWVGYYVGVWFFPIVIGIDLVVLTWYEVMAKATLDLDNNTITVTSFGPIWSKHVQRYSFDRVVECKVSQNMLDGVINSGVITLTIIRYLNTDESDQQITLPRVVNPHVKAEAWGRIMPWKRDIAIQLKR